MYNLPGFLNRTRRPLRVCSKTEHAKSLGFLRIPCATPRPIRAFTVVPGHQSNSISQHLYRVDDLLFPPLIMNHFPRAAAPTHEYHTKSITSHKTSSTRARITISQNIIEQSREILTTIFSIAIRCHLRCYRWMYNNTQKKSENRFATWYLTRLHPLTCLGLRDAQRCSERCKLARNAHGRTMGATLRRNR